MSQQALDIAVGDNPGDVASTQELATQESDSEMQADQGEDTVTQEPVSQQALDIVWKITQGMLLPHKNQQHKN